MVLTTEEQTQFTCREQLNPRKRKKHETGEKYIKRGFIFSTHH
jgi:hypothetical protein